MDTLYDRCIDVLSQYCIYLIHQKRVCGAKLVGKAIEAVLNSTAESKPKPGRCEVEEKALPPPVRPQDGGYNKVKRRIFFL